MSNTRLTMENVAQGLMYLLCNGTLGGGTVGEPRIYTPMALHTRRTSHTQRDN